MKNHCLLFALLFLFTFLIPQSSQGQSITEIEYFFDYDDPGLGNATSITINPVQEIDSLISFDINSLAVGIHTLCVRIKDSDNVWSNLNTRSFFKLGGFDEPNVTELNYWFEGVNNNETTTISIPTTAALDEIFPLSVSDMEPGIYTLYVSAKNGFGQESILHQKSVQVFDGENGLELSSLEYFWNDDPGFGSGSNIPLIDLEIDSSFILNIPQSTEPQIDYLSLRVQDRTGKWSLLDSYPVINCPTPIPIADFETVCTGSVVSFVNLAQNATEYLWDFGDGTTSTSSNPLHQFAPGQYTIYHYATNECTTTTDSIVLEFNGVESYTPTEAGRGDVYMNFYGWGFDESTTVKLYKDGQTYESFNDIQTNIGNAYRGILDLHEAPLGFYDVELITAVGSYFYENGLELQEPEFALRTDIIGHPNPRINVEENYSVRVHNDGNIRAGSILLYLFVPNGATVTPLDSIVWADSSILLGYDTIPNFFDVYEENGYPSDGKMHIYMLYDVPSNYYKDVRFNILFEELGPKNLEVWVQGPFSGSPWYEFTDPCFRAKLNLGYQLTTTLISLIPVADCGVAGLKLLGEPIAIAVGTIVAGGSFDEWASGTALKSVASNFAGVIKDCSGEAAAVATAGTSLGAEFYLDVALGSVVIQEAYYSVLEHCHEVEDIRRAREILVVASRDPNAKSGPHGYAEANFINGNELWMDYTIFFENVDTADVPAQVVTILDTLDMEVLDLSSFKLNSCGVAENVLNIPTNRIEFVNTVNLGNGLMLRANLKLDTLTGIFRADFFTIDSLTNDLTTDPAAGFLPPNVNKPEGEGNISFSIKLKEGLPNNTPIANQASIIFDTNEAIKTNIWSNTLDILAPTSTVVDFYQIGDTTAVININGTDTQSGIYAYEVYINQNNDGWALLGEFRQPFVFNGLEDDLYEFYFQAIDSVGNVESKEAIAEVSIQFEDFNAVQTIADNQEWSIYPIPAQDLLFVDFKDYAAQVNSISIFDVNGKLVYQANNEDTFNNRQQIDIRNLALGFHYLEMELSNGKHLRKYFVKN